MSTFTDIVQDLETPGNAATENDRRKHGRAVSMFLPCCVETDDQVQIGLVRNLSAGGALIETDIDLPVGTTFKYYWDGVPAIEAKALRTEGGAIAVQNVSETGTSSHEHPRRTIRIPCNLQAAIWHGGVKHSVGVANVSFKGALIYGLPAIEKGALVSVEIGGIAIHNVCVRWASNGSVGLCFGQNLKMTDLATILNAPAFGKLGRICAAEWKDNSQEAQHDSEVAAA